MKIKREKTLYHNYFLESDYSQGVVDFCRYLKENFGWKDFQWDADKKVWRFKDISIITLIKNKFNETDIDEVVNDIKGYKEFLDQEKLKEENAVKIKNATITNFTPRGVKGELYDYQKIGVEFLVNSGGRALLSDSPGVGKTAQSLAYLTHMDFKRNLIVCPASVKFAWENEIKKWTNLKSFVIQPNTNLNDIPYDIDCLIVNFDILKKFFNEFMKYNFSCLIGDEIQLIKSSKAIRTKVFKAIAKEIPHVILLTGTPVLSRPIEIFNTLNIIDPKTWNNYYSYATKYCGGRQGRYGFEAKGATNLEELHQKISKYFLRRTKEDVLKELPPKNRIEIPIELPEYERRQYDLVEENLVKYLKTFKKEKTNKEILKSMHAEKLVKLNLLREINAMGKIPTAKELIDSIVESGEKVLVFSSFNAPLKELNECYEENSVLLLGETSVDDRGDIVKQFQENPKTKVFLGGFKSAGVGITLTQASNIICLDLPWNPADLEQSENRAHRPGAEYESLNIYTIISKDTIDNFMQQTLRRKQEIIDKVIEGESAKDKNKYVNEYIKTLEIKYNK